MADEKIFEDHTLDEVPTDLIKYWEDLNTDTEDVDTDTHTVILDNKEARGLYKRAPDINMNITEFKEKLDLFTCNSLEGIDWENIIIAGGAVVACLISDRTKFRDSFDEICVNADIDVFMYSVTEEAKRTTKIRTLFNTIRNNRNGNAFFVKTMHTYTAYSVYPYRPVQLIRTAFKDPDEILNSFDIDCCAVAYQGPTEAFRNGRLFGLPRAADALQNWCNVVNLNLRGLNYEQRLIKYSKRGFRVVINNNDWMERDNVLIENMDDTQTKGILMLFKHDQLIKKNASLAATEERTRYVPFRGYNIKGLMGWFATVNMSHNLAYGVPFNLNDFYKIKEINKLSGSSSIWKEYKRILAQSEWFSPYKSPSIISLIGKTIAKKEKIQKYIYSESASDKHLKTLEKYYTAHNVCDLHTHLTGMGTFEFWFEKILHLRMYERRVYLTSNKYFHVLWYGPQLGENLPEVKKWDDHLPGSLVTKIPNSVFDNREYDNDDLVINLNDWKVNVDDALIELLYKEEINSSIISDIKSSHTIDKFKEYFTGDVVFPLLILAEAFGLYRTDNDPYIYVTNILGISSTKYFRPYIYYNQIEQKFCYCEKGLSSKDLWNIVKNPKSKESKKAKNALMDAFCITNRNGGAPSSVQLIQDFRENFTPQFYPRRFLLRKVIMEQDLRSLELLICHVLLRYSTANVSHVEFSLGISDLLKPWVIPYLFPKDAKSIGVTYRYLAAFTRASVKIKIDNKMIKISDLQKNREWEILKSVTEKSTSLTELINNKDIDFESPIESLLQLQGVLNDSAFLRKYVVGLDLMGDEKGAPYIPFVDEKFISFALEMSIKTNRTFGFRIHGGEISYPSDTKNQAIFNKHMQILIDGIRIILGRGIPVRIGHGVGFAHCVSHENEFNGIQELYNKVLIEINPTSNYQLLGVRTGTDDPAYTHAALVLKKKFPIILCTDDDGVLYPLERKLQDVGPKCVSLACEYYMAAQLNILETNEIETCINNGERYKFGQLILSEKQKMIRKIRNLNH
jgi:hypothetical protein